MIDDETLAPNADGAPPAGPAAATSEPSASARVLDFAAARAARQAPAAPKRRWAAIVGGAVAACLAIALLMSWNMDWSGHPMPTAGAPDGIVADARLVHALDGQLAGAQDPGAPIRIGLTVRAADGRYCRTFSLEHSAGLACRGASAWTVRALAPSEDAGAGRTAASALPPSVLQSLAALSPGPTLDAKAEAAARQRNWR